MTGGPAETSRPAAESTPEQSPPAAAVEAPPAQPPIPYTPPPDYAPPPPFGTAPPAAPRNQRRTLLIIGITALVVVLVLVGGGVAGNAVLSSTYSPDRAVTDYFAAQSKGDVNGMMANASFQVGSNPDLFTRSAIAPMMDVPQNKDVQSVKIASSQSIDSSTQSVAVTMTWAGKPRSQTYTVQKDNAQVHDLFYHSWRIVIPFVTIHLALPNQAGTIGIDGIAAPGTDSIEAVEGYHSITMSANFLYDGSSQVVDGVDGSPTATFAPNVSSSAMRNAGDAVKAAFKICDTTQYKGCVDHTYSAPNDGYSYYFPLPGYGDVYFTTYRLTLTSDPSTGMKLDVPTTAGKVNASGTCAVTMTVDGSSNYYLKGPWTGVLTWGGSGSFTAQLTTDCLAAKA